MGNVRGYYVSRTPTLLKSFEKTAELVKESVISRYGDELARDDPLRNQTGFCRCYATHTAH